MRLVTPGQVGAFGYTRNLVRLVTPGRVGAFGYARNLVRLVTPASGVTKRTTNIDTVAYSC